MATFTILNPTATGATIEYVPGIGTPQSNTNIQSLYTITTDATITPLNISNTTTNRIVIPATSIVQFSGLVIAMCNVSSSSNFSKTWEIKGSITRDTINTTRLVGVPIISVLGEDADGTQKPSTWEITSITADDINESLAINVKGQAGQKIRWFATLFYAQGGF